MTTVSQLDSGCLTRYGLDTSRVRSGVDTKRIVYRTIDALRGTDHASALVAVSVSATFPSCLWTTRDLWTTRPLSITGE